MTDLDLNSDIVWCKDYNGWGITPLLLFNIGPKCTIMCGKCELTFKTRLPLVRLPVIVCPHCKIRNRIPVEF